MIRGLWATMLAASGARARELESLNELVRRPLPLSTRVGFAGVDHQVGCSVVAGLSAAVLAARRTRRVLAVNASTPPPNRSLLWHADLYEFDPTAMAQTGQGRADVGTFAQATTGLATTSRGLCCLDVSIPSASNPYDSDTWAAQVAPISRFFDFVLTDWGMRTAQTIGPVLTASNVICLVTPADRIGLQYGVDLAHSVRAAGIPVLLAAVDLRRTPAGIPEAIRLLPMPAIEFPRDRAHRSARPLPSRRLRPATNLAALRLTAALVQTREPHLEVAA